MALPVFNDSIEAANSFSADEITRNKRWHISKIPVTGSRKGKPAITSNDLVNFVSENHGMYLVTRLWLLTWLMDRFRGFPNRTAVALVQFARAIVDLQVGLSIEAGKSISLTPEELLRGLRPSRHTLAYRILVASKNS